MTSQRKWKCPTLHAQMGKPLHDSGLSDGVRGRGYSKAHWTCPFSGLALTNTAWELPTAATRAHE